ncbi:MAG: EAL domain-containing protein [Acidimicrobiales bacterium]
MNEARNSGPARVLVVEDDDSVRRFLTTLITTGGYRAVEASDGPAALAALARDEIDLVLLDLGLAGMSGLDVLGRIRSDPDTAQLPVIIVTGADQLDDRVAGLDSGASDYITKPFEPDELLARVRAQIRQQESWGETVADLLGERARLLRHLGQAAGQSGPEATAAGICDGVLELDGVAGAAVVWFDQGRAVPLSTAGTLPGSIRDGQTLSGALSRYLEVKATLGPWIEMADHSGAESDRPGLLVSAGALACAPLGARQGCIGLLMVAIDADSSMRAARSVLSATIDFAGAAEEMLRSALSSGPGHHAAQMQISSLLADGSFRVHYQPIIRLNDRSVVGHEALTRFDDGADPESRFAQASAVGMGLRLEESTMARSIQAAADLPPDTWLGLNASPQMIMTSDCLLPLLEEPDRTLVLELSEHEPVSDYNALRAALDRLDGEVLLSVDDAGAGFASLRHVLILKPAFMKLDRSWVHGLESDPAKMALIAGLQSYASKTGCELIAEGIETEAELTAVRELGVNLGQGYLLGRPAPVVKNEARQSA